MEHLSHLMAWYSVGCMPMVQGWTDRGVEGAYYLLSLYILYYMFLSLFVDG